MRVNSVGQENKSNNSNVLKAGVIGAAAGALVRNFAPITTSEYDTFFNSAALSSIEKKAKDARIFEIGNIENEFNAGKLNVANEAFDTFIKHKDEVADSPKKALNIKVRRLNKVLANWSEELIWSVRQNKKLK